MFANVESAKGHDRLISVGRLGPLQRTLKLLKRVCNLVFLVSNAPLLRHHVRALILIFIYRTLV